MPKKIIEMSLSPRDKTPAPSGYGFDFHHTDPQRRVPCILGDMLAPLSADDIPPITPEAMASVQAALKLLADLVGDRDVGRFLGDNDPKLEEHRAAARTILSAGRGLAGILRVEADPDRTAHAAATLAAKLAGTSAEPLRPCVDYTLAVLGAGAAAPTVPPDGNFTPVTFTYPARANAISRIAAEAPTRTGPGAYVVTHSPTLPLVLSATGRVHHAGHMAATNDLEVAVTALHRSTISIEITTPAGVAVDLGVHDMLVLKLVTIEDQ